MHLVYEKNLNTTPYSIAYTKDWCDEVYLLIDNDTGSFKGEFFKYAGIEKYVHFFYDTTHWNFYGAQAHASKYYYNLDELLEDVCIYFSYDKLLHINGMQIPVSDHTPIGEVELTPKINEMYCSEHMTFSRLIKHGNMDQWQPVTHWDVLDGPGDFVTWGNYTCLEQHNCAVTIQMLVEFQGINIFGDTISKFAKPQIHTFNLK